MQNPEQRNRGACNHDNITIETRALLLALRKPDDRLPLAAVASGKGLQQVSGLSGGGEVALAVIPHMPRLDLDHEAVS